MPASQHCEHQPFRVETLCAVAVDGAGRVYRHRLAVEVERDAFRSEGDVLAQELDPGVGAREPAKAQDHSAAGAQQDEIWRAQG